MSEGAPDTIISNTKLLGYKRSPGLDFFTHVVMLDPWKNWCVKILFYPPSDTAPDGDLNMTGMPHVAKNSVIL